MARAAAAFAGVAGGGAGERAAQLRALAEHVREHREELAQLEARNAGKPIGDARGEMGMVADMFRYYAGAPERLLGDTIPVAGGQAWTVREPLGVVGLIVPWNFPLTIAAWKLGPALAAGNTVVLKPAELTPLTALRFAELALEAGLPDGVLNVVVGPGSVCGARLVEHPDVAKIAFTGSTEVGPLDRRRRGPDDQARHARAGRQVAQHGVRRRRPGRGGRRGARGRCSATPARTAARARGSWCSATAMDEFMAELERAVTAIRVGDPLDEDDRDGAADLRGPARGGRIVRGRRARRWRFRGLGARRPGLLVCSHGPVPG